MSLQKDLVCGMEVDEAKADHMATFANVTYYFCSDDCKETFKGLAKGFSKDFLESMPPIQSMVPDGARL